MATAPRPRVDAEAGVYPSRAGFAVSARGSSGSRVRRYRSTTMSEHDQPIAPNILNREFEADAPNQRWVGDTTELLTPSGKFYLAAIVDLYARFVVGWRR